MVIPEFQKIVLETNAIVTFVIPSSFEEAVGLVSKHNPDLDIAIMDAGRSDEEHVSTYQAVEIMRERKIPHIITSVFLRVARHIPDTPRSAFFLKPRIDFHELQRRIKNMVEIVVGGRMINEHLKPQKFALRYGSTSPQDRDHLQAVTRNRDLSNN